MISQPKNKRFKTKQFDGELVWNPSFSANRTASFERAQKFIDNECIRLMKPYTPFLSGVLEKSATIGTVLGSGEIKQTAPYARYQYYGELMVSSTTGSAWSRGESKVLTGAPLGYNTSKHPLAGKMWFERMKADKKDVILRGSSKIAGDNPQ